MFYTAQSIRYSLNVALLTLFYGIVTSMLLVLPCVLVKSYAIDFRDTALKPFSRALANMVNSLRERGG